MCARFWRDCKCGNSVHINFMCDKCGADVWGVNIRRPKTERQKEYEKELIEQEKVEKRLRKSIKNDIHNVW